MRAIKNLKYALLCVIVFICEISFAKYIEIGGAVPALSFSLCLAWAMTEKSGMRIAVISAAMGAVLDAFSGHGFATYTVLFMVVSLICYEIRDKLFSSKALFLVFCAFIMSIAVNLIYCLFHIETVNGGLLNGFTGIILPSALYNTAISELFYFVLRKIPGF